MIKTHIILVGCGKMGSALLEGWLKNGCSPELLTVIEPESYKEITERYQVRAVASYAEVKNQLPNHTVIFAVKPQILSDILPDYAVSPKIDGYITIAAGKTIAFYESLLNGSKAVGLIRAMPNLPATIGCGMTGLCSNAHANASQRQLAAQLFAAVGESIWVEEENLLDAVTAISGSGPAYVFHFIEALSVAGKELGLDETTSMKLALATVHGGANLAWQSSAHVTELKKAVTSPKGTTEAALSILEGKEGLVELIKKTTKAAAKRAKELAA